MNVLYKNDTYICEGRFDLKYDLSISGEPESLLSHFDKKTMEIKEI